MSYPHHSLHSWVAVVVVAAAVVSARAWVVEAVTVVETAVAAGADGRRQLWKCW